MWENVRAGTVGLLHEPRAKRETGNQNELRANPENSTRSREKIGLSFKNLTPSERRADRSKSSWTKSEQREMHLNQLRLWPHCPDIRLRHPNNHTLLGKSFSFGGTFGEKFLKKFPLIFPYFALFQSFGGKMENFFNSYTKKIKK